MSAVIPFHRPSAARQASWSQQELAEFYRVEAALIRAGIGIASDHGLSDEGEPWFVFCRPDGDAIMHFARIDGSYLIASEVLDRPVRGPDFRAMIDQIARLHPNLLPIPAAATGTKLVVHPAALLAALVAAAALSLSAQDAHAGEIGPGPEAAVPPRASGGGGGADGHPHTAKARGTGGHDEQDGGRRQVEAIILSTMIFAAEALAGDHNGAQAAPGLSLTDLSGGAPNHLTQGEGTHGSGGASGSGVDTAAASQPAVLSGQGSGTSPGSASPGGRIDGAAVIRADVPGDKAVPAGADSGHPAPGFAGETVPGGPAAEGGSAKTSSQPSAAPDHADAPVATGDGAGAGAGDQRGASPAATTVDTGTLIKAADAGQPESGSGSAGQTWVNAAAHAALERNPAAAPSSADGGAVRGDGTSARLDTTDDGRAADDRDGHGRGVQPVTAVHDEGGSGSHDGGPALTPGGDGHHPATGQGKFSPASGDGPASGSDGGHATGADPAGKSDAGASASHGAKAQASAAGAAASGTGSDGANGPAADAASHGAGYSTAPGQGAEKAAAAPAASAGHGPDQGDVSSAASGAADKSPHGDPSSGESHGQTAQAPSADDGTGPGHSDSHGAAMAGASHPSGGAESHGKGAASEDPGGSGSHGAEASSAQDHAGSAASSDPGASHAAVGAQHSQAEQASSGHGPDAGSSAAAGGGQAQAAHATAAAELPTSPDHSHPPTGSHGDAALPPGEAAADRGQGPSGPQGTPGGPAGHGSAEPPAGTPPAGQPEHAAAGTATVQAAASPPPGQAPSPDRAGSSADASSAPHAAIDPGGNLVFHGDAAQGSTAPAGPHGPVDSGAHPAVGLVGLADQPHVVHDLYHHG